VAENQAIKKLRADVSCLFLLPPGADTKTTFLLLFAGGRPGYPTILQQTPAAVPETNTATPSKGLHTILEVTTLSSASMLGLCDADAELLDHGKQHVILIL
jgi:hypothetical protein